MTLSDILIEKERAALAGPAASPVQELFPFLKHTPCIDWIIAEGNLYRAQEQRPLPFFGTLYGDAKLVQLRRDLRRDKRSRVQSAIREFWPGPIIGRQLIAYHVSLAGRALDYARQHLPGIVMEAPNFEQTAKERLEMTSSEAMNEIVGAIISPMCKASEAVTNIKTFYDRIIQR